jgi:heptosyltransferase-3
VEPSGALGRPGPARRHGSEQPLNPAAGVSLADCTAPLALPKPRVLVIRGGAIGDFILTLPAIRLLREAFPTAHLEILGYRHIVALAENRFYADAIRSIEYSAMAGFFVPNSDLAPDLAEYFASFQQVISFLFDPDGFFEANLRRAGVANFLPAYAKIDDSEHAARQLARPLQSLALFLEEHAATVHPTDADRAEAAQFLGKVSGRLVAIHPGSGSPRKNWPVTRWQELGTRLIADGAELLVLGGEADRPQLAALRSAWRDAPVREACDLPLPLLAAVLEQCALFLGHDSGISHLAAAVGTRCVLLFGSTDPAIWAPANPTVTVLEAPGGDFARIDVPAVQAVVQRIASDPPVSTGRGR